MIVLFVLLIAFICFNYVGIGVRELILYGYKTLKNL